MTALAFNFVLTFCALNFRDCGRYKEKFGNYNAFNESISMCK